MLRTEAAPVRFLADCMLGRLAKWLRILGYDCRYDRTAEDDEIVRLAEAEDRVILTRDVRLTERRRARRFLLIDSVDPDEQIRQVAMAFALVPDPERILSRCLRCNAALEPVEAERAAAEVPPYVAATQAVFRRCPACVRLYWGATHRDEVLRRIQRVFGPGGSESPR